MLEPGTGSVPLASCEWQLVTLGFSLASKRIIMEDGQQADSRAAEGWLPPSSTFSRCPQFSSRAHLVILHGKRPVLHKSTSLCDCDYHSVNTTLTMASTTASRSSTSDTIATAPDLDTAASSSASARRARKREQDRRCQRMLRERTKNRIAYLEGLLADFEREGSSAALHIMRKERDEAVEDRDRLVQALRTINRVIKTSVPSLTTLQIADVGDQQRIAAHKEKPLHKIARAGATRQDDINRGDEDEDDDNEDEEEADENGDEEHTLRPDGQSQVNMDCFRAPVASVMDNMVTHAWPAASLTSLCGLDNAATYLANPTLDPAIAPLFPSISPNAGACECSARPPPETTTTPHLWTLANDVLGEPIPWSHDISQMEDALAEDIPVRAVVEGWEAAARSVGGTLPQSWQQLRKIDEGLFFVCGTAERLAVLRTMHSLLVARADTTLERRTRLPDWYFAR